MGRLLSIIGVVFLAACRSGGPSAEPQVKQSNYEEGLASEAFVRASCEKLTACFGELPNCSEDVQKLENIDAEIGISPGGFKTLKDIIQAEKQGLLRPNAGPRVCLQDIANLSCRETRVQGAYLPGQEQPYRGLAEMVPENCHGLFGI